MSEFTKISDGVYQVAGIGWSQAIYAESEEDARAYAVDHGLIGEYVPPYEYLIELVEEDGVPRTFYTNGGRAFDMPHRAFIATYGDKIVRERPYFNRSVIVEVIQNTDDLVHLRMRRGTKEPAEANGWVIKVTYMPEPPEVTARRELREFVERLRDERRIGELIDLLDELYPTPHAKGLEHTPRSASL